LLGLYTRSFNGHALLAGWAAGTAAGTYMAAMQGFTSSIYPLELFGITIPTYAALSSVLLNLAVAVVLAPLFDLMGRRTLPSPAQ
jgi:SSS family solute:Na+ symporter